MIPFIYEQLFFYAATILVLFIPGFFIMRAVWKKNSFSAIEEFTVSFGLSVVTVNFLMLLMGKMGIVFTRTSMMVSIGLVALAAFLFARRMRKDGQPAAPEKGVFTVRQTALIVMLLFLTVFIKTAYLTDSIFPTSTDMGHHMYWSKLIAETGELPEYAKREILEDGSMFFSSDPRPIADFIVGEHLIFSAVSILSGADLISALPTLISLLINIAGILALFIFSYRLFENTSFRANASILTLLLSGPLWALSSPQAKFVSGGVIGNILGNLMIPLALYFFYRAFSEKNKSFMGAALFLSAGIFYIHHLSAFIFIFIVFFSFVIYILFNLKRMRSKIKDWISLVINPAVLSILALIALFAFFVYIPNYITGGAVDTAVGGPSKSTRAGLTFTQLAFSSGQARLALGLAGLALLLASRSRHKYSHAFLSGWIISVFLMSWKPQWLYLDIPSNRVANYLSLPLIIASAYFLAWLIGYARKAGAGGNLFRLSAAIFLLFAFSGGFFDNSQTLRGDTNATSAVQVYEASRYTNRHAGPDDDVIKDHNYLTADAWIKLFFMRDYNFPYSRAFFKRYEDSVKERETCTLDMISLPNSEAGTRCFNDLGVNFVIVHPRYDDTQFEKSDDFWKIYSSEDVSVFYRN